MSNQPEFPSAHIMKRQFPLVRALIRKDFKKNMYGNFPTLVIRNGLFLFLIGSAIAMGMRDDFISSRWDSDMTMYRFAFMTIVLMIFPLHFIGGISAETLQGTFRNVSLYPIGIHVSSVKTKIPL